MSRPARVTAAILAGVLAALVVVVSIGLLGVPAGAGDNGDGMRLSCGAGLSPLTPDGRANWKGGVVLGFATGASPCPDPIVSSALPVLRLATTGGGATFSLRRLGLLYALGVGVVTAVAAWALGPRGRLLVLVPALLPLAGLTFSRFFVSTFSEPAGLLGTCALCLGAAVIAVTARVERAAHVTGLVLVAAGGLLAATAKASCLPLLVVAVALCAVTAVGGRAGRVVGLTAAVVLTLAALAPVVGVVQWQDRHFAAVNAHNLVFTAVLPEVGVAALAPLGLPAAAMPFAGRAYYPDGIAGVPGAAVVRADPLAARLSAYRVLAGHPGSTVDAIGLGLEATLGASLTYLPSTPWTDSAVGPVLGTTVGEQGADRDQLQDWLHGLAVPWAPALVVVLGVASGIVAGRHREPLVRALARLAALTAVSAVGLVVAAVLGDGFFEIAKHVWLAAYLLEVSVAATVLAGVVAGWQRLALTQRDRPTGWRSRAAQQAGPA